MNEGGGRRPGPVRSRALTGAIVHHKVKKRGYPNFMKKRKGRSIGRPEGELSRDSAGRWRTESVTGWKWAF